MSNIYKDTSKKVGVFVYQGDSPEEDRVDLYGREDHTITMNDATYTQYTILVLKHLLLIINFNPSANLLNNIL